MINRKIEFGLKIRISRNQFEEQNSLDAGIQDRSTSISIMYEIEEMSHEKKMVMKVTNIYKHDLVLNKSQRGPEDKF